MFLHTTRFVRTATFVLFSGVASLLAGCGAGLVTPPAPVAAATPGPAIQGHVHGGVYPIQGATIRLMETQSNGYGGAAKQLLQTTSDTHGFFTFPDQGWTCDAGQYAYITVSSGHTTASVNNSVVQVGAIGGCSTDLATVSEIDNVNVFISELSTLAAAYALSNFTTINNTNASAGGQIVNISAPAINNVAGPICTGTNANMTCTAAGLQHGFANAYNLVDSVRYDGSNPTGQARATVPTNSLGIAPQALLNTLGNILQSCVDSSGGSASVQGGAVHSDGSHCGDLFQYATPPSGTVPSNTLQVALNMAQNPTSNVASLFALQPRAVFFTPTMTTAPTNFSLSIFYLGSVSAGVPNTMPYPIDVALDAQDNIYVLYAGSAANNTYSAVNGFASNGTPLFTGGHNPAATVPSGIALDNSGHVWYTDDSASGSLWQLSSASGAVMRNIPVANGYPSGVAVDGADNIWISRDASSNQSLYRFDLSSNYASTSFQTCTMANASSVSCSSYQPQLGASAKRILVDSNQNIWGVTSSGTSTAVSFAYPFGNSPTTGLVTQPLQAAGGFGVAVTGDLTAYFPLKGQLNTAAGNTTDGITANANGSYANMSNTGAAYNDPIGVAIDGNGTVYWTDFEAGGQLFSLVPGADGTVSSGTLTSFLPCYASAGACSSSAVSSLRSLAADSSGALWYVSAGAQGMLIQTLGLAAPSWPLLSYAGVGTTVDGALPGAASEKTTVTSRRRAGHSRAGKL